jgi:hypothetical protein
MKVTHGGDIWLDKPIPIDVDFTVHITGLPSRGMDPAQFLDDKQKDKSPTKEMKNKCDTERGMRRIIIKWISDTTTKMGAKIMSCRMLRICRKEEVSAEVVAAIA